MQVSTLFLTLSLLGFISCIHGQERKCSIECQRVVDLACGTDGRTYLNECVINRRRVCNSLPSLGLAYKGRCSSQCRIRCPPTVQQVCGSDGKTYTNECYLLQEKRCNGKPNITRLHMGLCTEKSSPNALGSENSSRQSVTRNAEDCPLPCDKDFISPICGSDGRIYRNDCFLDNAKFCTNMETLTKRHAGPCVNNIFHDRYPATCPYVCSDAEQPVCGTDSRTYMNQCTLHNVRHCEGNIDLFVQHSGKCPLEIAYVRPDNFMRMDLPREPTKEEQCREAVCQEELRPVCGTDGITYNNECYLTLARKCNADKSSILLLHEGRCNETAPSKLNFTVDNCEDPECPNEISRLCGTDGRTYLNLCHLMTQRACSGKDTLYVRHQGECQNPSVSVDSTTASVTLSTTAQHSCLRTFPTFASPVCGSDLVLYRNPCHLNSVAACKGSVITPVNEDKCPEKMQLGISSQSPFCPSVCPTQAQPVCGSNGLTYDNECLLLAAKYCDGQTWLSVSYPGECIQFPRKCEFSCTRIEHVCGSDGITYLSDCHMRNMNVCYSRSTTRAHYGPCRRSPLTDFCVDDRINILPRNPTCGSNGVTYENQCILYKEKLCNSNPDLVPTTTGQCERQ